MSDEYEDYPLMMTHPSWRPSQVTITEASGSKVTAFGTPDAFPPVTVNNADQEEQHAAMGYVRRGKADPSAWAHLTASAPPVDYVPERFPMWVNGVLCENEDDEAEALKVSNVAAHPAEPEVSEVEMLKRQLAAMQARLDAQPAAPEMSRQQKAALTRKANRAA